MRLSFQLASLVCAILFTPVAVQAAEVWSLVAVPADPDTANQLRQLDVDVEGGLADRLHVLVRPQDLRLLDQAAIPYELLHPDHQSLKPETLGARGLSYHDPQGILYSLQAISQQYPEVARYVEWGLSSEGRPLGGLLLSDQPGIREADEPSLRLLGGHHGDEYSSVEVALNIAWTLVERYSSGDPLVRDLLDRNELWLAPLVNPDGHAAFTRRNSQNVDLNRNYSYLWSSAGASGETPFDQPETTAVRALSTTRSFHHSLSLHSGATNLGWVWNSSYDPTPEAEWLEDRSNDYLSTTEDPDFWITNGAEWYLTFGDTNDWSYGVRGGHDYTLEVSLDKTPKEEDLPTVVAYHSGPAIEFMEAGASEGLLLRVTDSAGRPVEAEIEHLDKGWIGYSDPETGVFARPIPSEEQLLAIRALGYPEVQMTVSGSAPPVLNEVMLSVHPGTVPSRIEGADVLEDGDSTLTICSPRLGEAQGEVEVLFSREGPFPAEGMRGETKAGSPCVSVDLSPEELVPEAWRRKGEWNVVVRANTGESLALLPTGVLIGPAAPNFSVQAISLEDSSIEERTDLTIEGTGLPLGALIRAIGPNGRRVLPSERPADLDHEHYRVSFDTTDWEDGPWSLRLFGAGHWLGIPSALLVADGGIEVQELGPPEEPDPPPTNPPAQEPDDPAILGASGCACGHSRNTLSPLGVQGLVCALLVGYSRRRRRTCL